MIYSGPLGRNSHKIIEYFEVCDHEIYVEINYYTYIKKVPIFFFLLLRARQFQEFQKSRKNTTLQHGCWKQVRFQLKYD